jgi:dCMP deaminase
MAHLPVAQQSIKATPLATGSTDIPPSISPNATGGVPLRKSGLKQALAYAQLSIMNNFASVDELEKYLGEVDLLNAERLRPGWDTYFMVCLFPSSHDSA